MILAKPKQHDGYRIVPLMLGPNFVAQTNLKLYLKVFMALNLKHINR